MTSGALAPYKGAMRSGLALLLAVAASLAAVGCGGSGRGPSSRATAQLHAIPGAKPVRFISSSASRPHPLGFPFGHAPPKVRWHVVHVRRIKQLITAPAVAANCPMRWGNTVAWAGPPRDSTSGGPLFTRTPKRVRVCVFRTPADNFAVGNFVRGFRLDASRTRRLLGALTGAGPRRGCARQRTFAVIIESPGSVAEVELGGCWRVERPERLAGTANRAVARSILGGG